MIKIEDILFWILILAIVGIIIWMLVGSPTLENGLISIGLFVIGSEILLWRALFAIDKRTSIGFEKVKLSFEKVKNNIDNLKNEINNRFDKINSRFDSVDNSLLAINRKMRIK